MKFTAEQIASILDGEVSGNPNAEVYRLSKIEEGTEGSLTFLSNPKYLNYIYSTQASVTIVNKTFIPENELATTLIKVEDAYQAFSKLLEFYDQVKNNKTGIEQPSVISQGVTYGDNFYLGSFSYIGTNVTIGDNVKIYQGVTLGALSVNKDEAKSKRHPTIEDNVVIYSGATILGGETVVGKDSVIGGNVWLTNSVLPRSIVYHKSESTIKDIHQPLPDVLNFVI